MKYINKYKRILQNGCKTKYSIYEKAFYHRLNKNTMLKILPPKSQDIKGAPVRNTGRTLGQKKELNVRLNTYILKYMKIIQQILFGKTSGIKSIWYKKVTSTHEIRTSNIIELVQNPFLGPKFLTEK